MKRILIATAILALGATLGISALATTGNDDLHAHLAQMLHHHKSSDSLSSHLDEICDRLDLNDSQRSQIATTLRQRIDPTMDAARELPSHN